MIKQIIITAFVSVLIASPCLADKVAEKYGFTLQEEKEIGFQSAVSLLKRYGHYKNKPVNDYVKIIGEKLVHTSSTRPGLKYRFIILDTEEVNAFAAPGGYVFITKGALKSLDNEAELAAVLGHEIAHIEAGDGLETIARDPRLREKIRAVKLIVGSGKGLNTMFEDFLENELENYELKPNMVNFDDVKTK